MCRLKTASPCTVLTGIPDPSFIFPLLSIFALPPSSAVTAPHSTSPIFYSPLSTLQDLSSSFSTLSTYAL